MPFVLCVARTVNGAERTFRWRGQTDDIRADVEAMIADFTAGRMRMENTLTLSADSSLPSGVSFGERPEEPDWARSWRWADIKDIWIEEGR